MTDQHNTCAVRDQVAAWHREHGDPFAVPVCSWPDELWVEEMPTENILRVISRLQSLLADSAVLFGKDEADEHLDALEVHQNELRIRMGLKDRESEVNGVTITAVDRDYGTITCDFGLTNGQIIVWNGDSLLEAGMKVSVKP